MALRFPLKRLNPLNSLMHFASRDRDAYDLSPNGRSNKIKGLVSGYYRIFVGSLNFIPDELWDERHAGVADIFLGLGLAYNLEYAATKFTRGAHKDGERKKALAGLIFLKGPLNLLRVAVGAPLAVTFAIPTLVVVGVGAIVRGVSRKYNQKVKKGNLIYTDLPNEDSFLLEDEPAPKPKTAPVASPLPSVKTDKNRLDYTKLRVQDSSFYWEITKKGKGLDATFTGTVKKFDGNEKWAAYSKVVMTDDAQTEHTINDDNVSAKVVEAQPVQKTKYDLHKSKYHVFRKTEITQDQHDAPYADPDLVQTYAYIPK